MNGLTLSRDVKRDVERGGSVVRRYEEFLQMPVAFVLAVMWAAGAILIGLCVATLHEGVLLVARLVG
jgi:hypothetical protein